MTEKLFSGTLSKNETKINSILGIIRYFLGYAYLKNMLNFAYSFYFCIKDNHKLIFWIFIILFWDIQK